jgi:hypothetical protein
VLAAKRLTEIPEKINKDIRKKGKKHIKYLDKYESIFKSKLEKMEISNNNNKTKNSVKKGIL